MTIDRFCEGLPNTGLVTGLSGLTLAIALTLVGAGLITAARRGALRTAAMALMPLALIVPSSQHTNTDGDQPMTEQQDCIQRPDGYRDFDGGYDNRG